METDCNDSNCLVDLHGTMMTEKMETRPVTSTSISLQKVKRIAKKTKAINNVI